MLQHAEDADRVGDQEVPLILIGEVAAGQNAGRGNWSHALFEPQFVADPFADVDIGPGSRGSVIGELVTPLVEDIAVWVGTDREMELHLKRSGIEPMDTAIARAEGFGRRFDRRDVEDPARPIEPTVGAE